MFKQGSGSSVLLIYLLTGAALHWGVMGVAHATDGTILINQQKAQTGSVTAGDAPGFPVTLSQPGSYTLSGNLTVPDQNTTAIQVTTDNVTINLNGFAILGPNIANGFGEGVSASSRTNVAVLNGTVRGMGSRGVYLGNKAYAEGLRLISNSDGIQVGIDSLIRDTMALGNRVAGIVASFGKAAILNSVANQNGEDGILTGENCLLLSNTAIGNIRYGMLIGPKSTVLQNTVVDNGSFGLFLDTKTGYAQNVIADNGAITGPQVSGGVQMGTNVCGSDTVCP